VVGRKRLEVALVSERRDHHVAARVRVRVEHDEGALVSCHDVGLVGVGGREPAEEALVAPERVARDLVEVRRAPARPEPLEWHQRCGASSTSSSATNVSSGTPRSGSSLPRRFTPTVRAATSSSPTTSTYGTFSVLARATRAPSFWSRASCTSARTRAA